MGAFDIRTEAPCNFSNLAYLLMVCHLLMPLLGIPLTFILLPREKLSDDLMGAIAPKLVSARAASDDNDHAPLLTGATERTYGGTQSSEC